MARSPDNVVASPYDGIKKGSTVIINIPNPKPVTRCIKEAPLQKSISKNRSIAFVSRIIGTFKTTFPN